MRWNHDCSATGLSRSILAVGGGFEIAPHEVIGAGTGFQSDGASIIGRGDAVLLGQREYAQDTADGSLAFSSVRAWLGTTRRYAIRLLPLGAVTVRSRVVCAMAGLHPGCDADRAAGEDARARVAPCADR